MASEARISLEFANGDFNTAKNLFRQAYNCKAESGTLDDLGKLVVSEIQKVEGITRTFTCPVVNL